MKKSIQGANGFSMIEMLVTVFIFTVIAGTVFSLLLSSQMRYQSESNLTSAFQQANVALDQITRDVHSAGYPPASSFTSEQAFYHPENVAMPFAWSPTYPSLPCTVGATCLVPGDYDLILEADLGGGVQWIRYSLQGTTLMRGVTVKQPNVDPASATAPSTGLLTPYLDNVMNGPANKSVPIFSYYYDSGATPQPSNIREVNVCLIVQSAKPDPQTGQIRTITLTGQAARFNPDK
jgi:prepilin-type N-terminal cleavage/methylation domain-containing protein